MNQRAERSEVRFRCLVRHVLEQHMLGHIDWKQHTPTLVESENVRHRTYTKYGKCEYLVMDQETYFRLSNELRKYEMLAYPNADYTKSEYPVVNGCKILISDTVSGMHGCA